MRNKKLLKRIFPLIAIAVLLPWPIAFAHDASDGVIGELNQSLEHHELLKVRVNAEDREERETLIEQMCKAVSCNLVQRIGHIALIYRPAEEPVLKLPR